MPKVDLSIIIPCHNEGSIFEDSVEKIVAVLKTQKKKWEMIFVEDKSVDDTKKTVEKLTQKYKNIRAIFHKKNEGRGKSVSDVIKTARGDICGYLDIDLEVSEKYIPLFVNEIERGSDLAVGTRFYEGGLKSFPRFLASKAYALIIKSTFSIPVDDTETGYKFFNRKKIILVLKKVK